MANEFAFMFINIEDQIAQYKQGMISEQVFVDAVQRALDSYGGELATIKFDEPTSVFGRNGGSTGNVVDGDTRYKITKL